MILARVLAVPGIEHGFGTRHTPFDQDRAATLKQIHSNRVLISNHPGVAGEGDALITARPGLAIAIKTADCLPILLADPTNQVIAAVHAGWRGTDARIVEKTIRVMRERFGTEPRKLIAAIGPGIGMCCYEVGDDVARRFGLERRGKVDLARANREQLTACGVERMETIARCTQCEPDVFYSYRREAGEAGRMLSYLMLR